jgi:hypothetical protein
MARESLSAPRKTNSKPSGLGNRGAARHGERTHEPLELRHDFSGPEIQHFQRQINRAGNMTCPSMLLGDHGTLPGVRLLQFLSMESLNFEFLSDGLYSCIYNYWLKRQLFIAYASTSLSLQ